MRPALHQAQRSGGRRPARGVEVGVDEGVNALVMLTEWPELAELLLVDRDHDCTARVTALLAPRVGVDRWRFVCGDSVAVAETVPDGTMDFVYLDDDHSRAGVARSLTAWWPKVRWGGVFGGHDYDVRSGDDEVQASVDAFFREHGVTWHVDGLDWWAVR